MNASFGSSDMWQQLATPATVVGGFATAIALAVGAWSLVLISRQTSRASLMSRETIALDAHKGYILLSLQNPNLSSSYMMSKHLKIKDFAVLFTGKPTDQGEEALWFMSYVLFAMSQIIAAMPDDAYWMNLVKAQLGYHRSLVEASWPYWGEMYNPPMRDIIQEVIRNDDPMAGFDIGQVWRGR